MLLLREISPETLSLLRRIYRSSKHHQVRQRAQFLIFYHQGQSFAQLMQLFLVSRQTLYNWLHSWNSRGIVGLYNQAGRGRKRTFNPEQEKQIYQWVQDSPIQLNNVLDRIKETWDIQYSGHFFRGVAGKLPTVIECKCHKHKAPMDSLQSILAEALAAVGCFTNPNVSFS